MAEIPHIAWPLRFAGDRLAVVEQDTLADVRQCVHLLVHTPIGARPLAPEIGLEDPTFAGVDPEVLEADLEEWEDRAAVTVAATLSPDGRQGVRIDVALAADTDPAEA